jgi:hypothetical protein
MAKPGAAVRMRQNAPRSFLRKLAPAEAVLTGGAEPIISKLLGSIHSNHYGIIPEGRQT